MEQRSRERILTLDIYTDGSLKKIGDITFGGWAFAAIRDQQAVYVESGEEFDTTNQRMELLAILKALQYAERYRSKNEKIVVYSDSAYAVNCYLQEWYKGWEAHNWYNSQKKPVANPDLWKEIIPFFENFWYDFRKVLGHAGQHWNEYVDKLAQERAQSLKDSWRGKNGI